MGTSTLAKIAIAIFSLGGVSGGYGLINYLRKNDEEIFPKSIGEFIYKQQEEGDKFMCSQLLSEEFPIWYALNDENKCQKLKEKWWTNSSDSKQLKGLVRADSDKLGYALYSLFSLSFPISNFSQVEEQFKNEVQVGKMKCKSDGNSWNGKTIVKCY
ncbi:hypothetical protein [Mycoplasma suis]|uniref:Uncharacterized protein n=2 Tax=Mycoplasma suis TaxID=57372 RepID=F0QQ83_MYCSL|nr:hypothetical protein [Mycoplasma suis]ADX97653.1 hypothetical protein MSU_0109 [Mycoplasma suis str. Illinois]CBZ40190.1 hypothetical protein MSUIS_00970 [Mycoplasma suis KI3806]